MENNITIFIVSVAIILLIGSVVGFFVGKSIYDNRSILAEYQKQLDRIKAERDQYLKLYEGFTTEIRSGVENLEGQINKSTDDIRKFIEVGIGKIDTTIQLCEQLRIQIEATKDYINNVFDQLGYYDNSLYDKNNLKLKTD